jgi:hypothetical protein
MENNKKIPVKTILSRLTLNVLFIAFLTTSAVLSSCSKHAVKIADTYVGTLVKNDSIISTNAQIIIEEVTQNRVSVSSSFFEIYEVKIDKKRYWASKTYYSVEAGEHLEVFDDGNIILLHSDASGDDFEFSGRKN